MPKNRIFQEANQEIYLGLILFNLFNKLDQTLLEKIRNLLIGNNNEESKLSDIRAYIKDLLHKNKDFMNSYGYLIGPEGSNGCLLSYLFRIYNSLAIIKIKDYNLSYFEMLDNAGKLGFEKENEIARKGTNWIGEAGLFVKFQFVNAGMLLLLFDLIKQLKSEGKIKNRKIFDSIGRQYLLAKKIKNLFKPLTKEQYEDITNHFYVFKMDPKDGRCYYDLGSEKVYADDIKNVE